MKNESDNYSFTPIEDNNSIETLANDFFGVSSEPTNTNTEQPPILEGINEEQIEINNEAPSPAATPKEESAPVDIVIPEGLDDESQTSASEEATDTSTEVAANSEETPNTPSENVEPNKEEESTNAQPVTEDNPFDFFNVTEVPVTEEKTPENTTDAKVEPEENNNAEPETNTVETPREPEVVKEEPPTGVTDASNEAPVVTEPQVKEPEAEPNPSVEPPEGVEPSPVTEESNIEIPTPEVPTAKNLEPKEEQSSSVTIENPLFAEEKEVDEKIVVGRKCPNCDTLTNEDFCPNCGFLVDE